MKSSPIRDRWLALGICVFMAGIIWFVFGQTVRYGFVNFDDDVYVYKNSYVTGGLSASNVNWAFTHAHSSNWHPLTWLSHMLDCQWYGLDAGKHHLTNVLLHTVTAVLLFLVLRRMTGFLWRSAFVAAVFAIHPLRVESVAWIAERKDNLSGLLFMLSILAYAAYAQNPRSLGRYLITAFTMALALMAKPMVVSLPILFLLLDYWPLKRFRTGDNPGFPWRLLLEKIPLLALSATVCLVTVQAQKGAMSSPPLSLSAGNALLSCATYLKQMIYPVNLAVLYPFPTGGLPFWTVIAAALILGAISVVAAVNWRLRPWLLFGWLWHLVALLPVLGIVQVGSQAHADRYTYLPQIGLYIALAWTLAEFCRRPLHRLILGGAAVIIVGILALCARIQTSYWQCSETLWVHTLACTANNPTANINYGNVLLEKGDIDGAIARYADALRAKPDDWDANVRLGYAFIQTKRANVARLYLEKALELKPDDAEAYNDLGIVSFESGRLPEAIGHFEKALQIRPDYADAYYNYANALFQHGDMDQAIAHYQQALQFKPGHAEACYNLGNALFQKGNIEEAITCYQRASRLKPAYLAATYNLAMAFKQLGRLEEAAAQFRQALIIQPGSAETCYNLGNVLIQQGKDSEAVANLQQALQLKPDFTDALNDLAFELATAPEPSVRNGKRAVELAERASQITGGRDPDVLDTLAAAYAEAGKFAEAIRIIQNNIETCQNAGDLARLGQFKSELQLYQSNQPFHRASR